MPFYRDVLGNSIDTSVLYTCPRCRRKGGQELGPGIMRYACGSTFDANQAIFTEVHCEFKPLSPEGALTEAAINHAFYALYPDQWGYEVNAKNEIDGPFKIKIPEWSKGNADYLLWDTNVFLSVIANCDALAGASIDRGPDMNAVWIFDPCIEKSEHALLSMFVHANEHGLFAADMVQPLQRPDMPPLLVWYPPIRWGKPIRSERSALQMAAAYTWLQQPYVTQAPVIRHSRQVKREAERKGKSLPNISVIEFRRAEHRATETPVTGKQKEYHCCFERTGFPRRQWYPSEHRHKIIWIAPTLVGDPEKLPFKPKGVPLYRVRR